MKTYTRTRKHGTVETVPGNPTDRIAAIRRVVTEKKYAKIDGSMVDAVTANAICTVYDALNPEHQAKFAGYPAPTMATIAWKLIK